MQISVRQLGKTFRDKDRETVAYQDLTFDVKPGEFFCILGPSGCGKTTLLRTLAGLETATSGELQITSDSNQAANIAMVFQEHGLFPWMSLRNNIRFLLENNPRLKTPGFWRHATKSEHCSRVCERTQHPVNG
jgi:NitT/TauT family transport system ATP-binding protein